MNEWMDGKLTEELLCGLWLPLKLNTEVVHLHKSISALYSLLLLTVTPVIHVIHEVFSGSLIMASTSVQISLLYFQEAMECRSAESQ